MMQFNYLLDLVYKYNNSKSITNKLIIRKRYFKFINAIIDNNTNFEKLCILLSYHKLLHFNEDNFESDKITITDCRSSEYSDYKIIICMHNISKDFLISIISYDKKDIRRIEVSEFKSTSTEIDILFKKELNKYILSCAKEFLKRK